MRGGASNKNKGSDFERGVCKQLSLWWTEGKRKDVFWRTSGSGARASTRIKLHGEKTFGQHGDVQASDPDGQPLIDLCTIEIKKGYSKQTIFDLMDRLPTETKQPYKLFIQQARKDNADSDSHYWMLIAKRDYKTTMVIIPFTLYQKLKEDCPINRACPSFIMKIKIDKNISVFGTTLDEFFTWVDPSTIKDLELLKTWNEKEKLHGCI